MNAKILSWITPVRLIARKSESLWKTAGDFSWTTEKFPRVKSGADTPRSIAESVYRGGILMAEKISLTRGRNGFFSWINKIRNINIPVDLPRFTKYRPRLCQWWKKSTHPAKVLAKGQIAWHARAIQRSQFPLNKFRVFASRLLQNFRWTPSIMFHWINHSRVSTLHTLPDSKLECKNPFDSLPISQAPYDRNLLIICARLHISYETWSAFKKFWHNTIMNYT